MSALQPFARFAAEAGPGFALTEADWFRYRCPEFGISFEVPFWMQGETPAGTSQFSTVAQGSMILPCVFDVTFLASHDRSEECPESLSRVMAVQWAVDYTLAAAPSLIPLDLPGIDEAWCLAADIEDGVGLISSSWVTASKAGRIACLGVSFWSAERMGFDASRRTIASISGL